MKSSGKMRRRLRIIDSGSGKVEYDSAKEKKRPAWFNDLDLKQKTA